MKRAIVLHPFLFAACPVGSLLSVNIDFVDPRLALRALLVVTLAAAIPLIVLGLGGRDWHRAGLAVSWPLFLFFSYGPFYLWSGRLNSPPMVRHAILLSLWAIYFLLGLHWIWRRPGSLQGFGTVLNLTAAVALAFPAGGLVEYSVRASGDARVVEAMQVELNPPARPPQGQTLPDIYYIILDGYGRADVLNGLYGFDNAEFLAYLARKGFFVAEDSRSNYAQTALSLASSMNAQYLGELTELMGRGEPRRSPLERLVRESSTRAFLESLGYRTVSISSGYEYAEVKDADLYVSSYDGGISPFETLLLRDSAAVALTDASQALLGLPPFAYQAHRERVLFGLDRLADMPAEQGPKFVLAHVISPHPPFVFDANGDAVNPGFDFSLKDGSHFTGSPAEYLDSYRGQLQYVNVRVEQAIDRILAESAVPPVIILQGDHGPGALLEWEAADRTCVWERMSILNAYYLPGGDYRDLYASITPANSFRIVFNQQFGTRHPLLEDRSYFSTWTRPYDFIDVTDQIETGSCTTLAVD